VDDEGFVFIFTEHVLDKFEELAMLAGAYALAAIVLFIAGPTSRRVRAGWSALDHAGAGILALGALIVLNQIVNDFPVFIADGGQDVDDGNAGGELGILPPEERQSSGQIEEVAPGEHQRHGRGWQGEGLRQNISQ
jgi:hypothetical protein